MSALHVQMNLYGDWVAFIRNQLESLCERFRISTKRVLSLSEEDMIHTHFAVIEYLIPQVPRNVLKSEEFTCPPDFDEGLSGIETKIRTGSDLNPHLSRGFKDVLKKGVRYRLSKNVRNTHKRKLDFLFRHWGIHHLHLGSRVESDGFIERNGPLLFCRFDTEKAYFINVLPHGDNSWTDQDMIRILHDNWPQSIEMYRIRGVSGLSRTITNESVRALRDGNVNTLVEVREGVVYISPGGGVMTSGHPMEPIWARDRAVDNLEQMEKVISEQIESIFATARSVGFNPSDSLQFKLRNSDGEFYVEEVNCGFILRFSDDGILKLYSSIC